MIKVNSSDIYAIDYDKDTHVLTIQFHSGGIYEYSNVSESTFNQLLNAGSKGRYFHTFIKDRYPTRKIR